MFSKYLKKMPGPEIIAQKGSKAKLKNGVLAVIAKGGTEEGHRRKAKKKKMVAMDHLDYSLKSANLKGKNIQNILR